ncbi:DUF4429 domain-containing protein [Streptomyces spectabilis]|uniref:DUF4429 domain-containing protein n=1 Tax=Streptomyces spectabilis TaxID=68270 RepID=A0A5P2X808_STRST|nr:DUF4429 domain-containing protein [Streptomyces spectabilis]MBB5108284.1 hypothetical protein [Streptomyces spectabilis]MCI3901044.1 DUF4429 domain-containing protein [Streptomyces spectabilis]QEV58542.1 hypothetical protein CP982_07315 [Streptomyces spectabilis]GGV45623.1 hypothetical protein GCM10010245_71450 [Streptomyces spectabilis]
MDVKGVQASISFDGEWITIVKKEVGAPDRTARTNVRSISGTTCKPATRLLHGYIQLAVPGAVQAKEKKGIFLGGRPPHSDPNSLSIPYRSNDAAAKIVAAIEEARVRLSP